MNRSPLPRPGTGRLFYPPGAAIDWHDAMLDALERCVAQELSAAETARRVGVDVNALGRGGMILIWRYKHGRPV